jgi:hypothetical protein
MELDDLKNIWQSDKAQLHYNEAQLASMLRRSSSSAVEKLKRSVWFELIFSLIAGVVFLTYASTLPAGMLKWITVSILVLFVGYAIYFVKKLVLLNAFMKSDENVKTNLERLILSLSGYLKFYKGSYTVLYPVYFGLGIVFGAMETGPESFLLKVTDPQWVILLLGVAIAFFIFSTIFANWYLKKLYGNHIEKLKSVLKDLNAENIENPNLTQ